MYLIEKYPECFVEYRPIMVNGYTMGIECINDNSRDEVLGEIEKRVDIQRAKKAGCKGAIEICEFLNTGRKSEYNGTQGRNAGVITRRGC